MGIIAKAKEVAEKTNQAVINEQAQMNELAGYMEIFSKKMGKCKNIRWKYVGVETKICI